MPSKVKAWVFLILGNIFLAISVYPYYKFYKGFRKVGKNFMQAVDSYTKMFVFFIGMLVVYLFFSIVSNVIFSKSKRWFGRSFGTFLGRFTILLEYAGIVAMFLILFLR